MTSQNDGGSIAQAIRALDVAAEAISLGTDLRPADREIAGRRIRAGAFALRESALKLLGIEGRMARLEVSPTGEDYCDVLSAVGIGDPESQESLRVACAAVGRPSPEGWSGPGQCDSANLTRAYQAIGMAIKEVQALAYSQNTLLADIAVTDFTKNLVEVSVRIARTASVVADMEQKSAKEAESSSQEESFSPVM